MLSVKNRFHGHSAVRRVYRIGRQTRGQLFSTHVNKGDKVRYTKVAVVVSKKVHKSAVKRNRIRRRIYECMRYRLDNIATSAEIVITVYKLEVIDLPHDQMVKSVDEILKKAGLI